VSFRRYLTEGGDPPQTLVITGEVVVKETPVLLRNVPVVAETRLAEERSDVDRLSVIPPFDPELDENDLPISRVR
jgi:hypothetical protein